MKALYLVLALICLSTTHVAAKGVVNIYQLIDTIDKLNSFLTELAAVDKPDFNRISLSFIQPSIHTYSSGNLACTGIMGYYCDNRNQSLAVTQKNNQLNDGVADFTALKAGISKMHDAGLEVFLSVGGWDYNCREDIYCETLQFYNKSTTIVCDPSVNYSYVCEPEGQNQNFDYFPDPTDESWADEAYSKVIQFAEDLGCDGVDLDYEEFWHADYYRRDWDQESFIADVRSQSWKNTSNGTAQEHMQAFYNNLTYDDMVKDYASSSPDRNAGATGPFILPDTVDKLYRIMQSLQKAGPKMKFSFAGPAVGAIPIMVPQYGDSNSLLGGGVWWGGNLKGLLYSLVQKYGESALANWDIGLMTYDLGCKSGSDCGNGLPFDCTLVDQVEFYAGTYVTYLKNSNTTTSTELGDGDVKDVVPKYFNVPGLSTMFGFEIGHPAYPAYDDSWKKMIALETDVTTLLSSIGNQHEGIILWEMFKPTEGTYTNEASTMFVAQQACQSFDLGSNYDCKANIPYPPNSTVASIESLFLN